MTDPFEELRHRIFGDVKIHFNVTVYCDRCKAYHKEYFSFAEMIKERDTLRQQLTSIEIVANGESIETVMFDNSTRDARNHFADIVGISLP